MSFSSPPKIWNLFLWDNSSSCISSILVCTALRLPTFIYHFTSRNLGFFWPNHVLREEKEEKAISPVCSLLLFHTVLAWNNSHLLFHYIPGNFHTSWPTSRLDSCFGHIPLMHSTALSLPIESLKFSSVLSCKMSQFINVNVSPSRLAFQAFRWQMSFFLPSPKYIYAFHKERSTQKESWYISAIIKHEQKVIVSQKDSLCVYTVTFVYSVIAY